MIKIISDVIMVDIAQQSQKVIETFQNDAEAAESLCAYLNLANDNIDIFDGYYKVVITLKQS